MSPPTMFCKVLAASLAGVLAGAGVTASAQSHGGGRHDDIQLERLDRGLVAAVTGDGVFLSWRLLADEVTGYSDSGLTGADFKVYRNGKKIATVTDSTNFLDTGGDADAEYRVVAVERGWPPTSPTRSRPGPRGTWTSRCRSPPTASRQPARRTPTAPTTSAPATSTATASTSTSSSGTPPTPRTSRRSATPAPS